MKAGKKRQREPFSFPFSLPLDHIFPVESKRQLILTRMCEHSHQSAKYTAANLNELSEALFVLSLPCHPLSSHRTFSPLLILAPAQMGIRGRVRENVQLHLKFSFASLKVPSSPPPVTLQFHLRNFSGPPCPCLCPLCGHPFPAAPQLR